MAKLSTGPKLGSPQWERRSLNPAPSEEIIPRPRYTASQLKRVQLLLRGDAPRGHKPTTKEPAKRMVGDCLLGGDHPIPFASYSDKHSVGDIRSVFVDEGGRFVTKRGVVRPHQETFCSYDSPGRIVTFSNLDKTRLKANYHVHRIDCVSYTHPNGDRAVVRVADVVARVFHDQVGNASSQSAVILDPTKKLGLNQIVLCSADIWEIATHTAKIRSKWAEWGLDTCPPILL